MGGVVDTATEQGNSAVNLVGNVNYLKHIRRWELSGSFGYAQQVQTLYDLYTTSVLSYGGSVKRKSGSLYWMTGFSGNHSGISQFSGYSNRNETFFGMVRWRRYNVNGHYSQAFGTSILTPSGLVPVPGLPPPALPSPILYNATSYGGGIGFSPFRRGHLSASYGRANSDTNGATVARAFQSTLLNARFEYRLRKLNLEGNFTRLEQSTQTGVMPAEVNSYYIRISRWFSIF